MPGPVDGPGLMVTSVSEGAVFSKPRPNLFCKPDAAIQKARTVQTNLDAVLQAANQITTGLDAAFGRSPFFLVMNKKAWNGLESSHKIIIDRTTGAKWSAQATAIYEKAGAGGLKSVTGTGKHQIFSFSDADRAKMKSILVKARAKYVDELESQGIPAKAIIAAMGSGS